MQKESEIEWFPDGRVVAQKSGMIVAPGDEAVGRFPKELRVRMFGKFVQADISAIDGHGHLISVVRWRCRRIQGSGGFRGGHFGWLIHSDKKRCVTQRYSALLGVTRRYGVIGLSLLSGPKGWTVERRQQAKGPGRWSKAAGGGFLPLGCPTAAERQDSSLSHECA